MRILLTGCTNLHTNRRGEDITYGAMFPALREVLQRLDHDVDWRGVTAGEQLAGQYDLAVVGLIALNKLSAKKYKFGALWACSQLPHVVVVDDWKLRDVSHSISGEDGLWKCSYLDPAAMRFFYAAREVQHALEAVRYRWKCGIEAALIPAYPWGRRSILTDALDMRRPSYWDPTPWIERFGPPPDGPSGERTRRWILAALSQHAGLWLDKLDPKPRWEVIRQFPERDVAKWELASERDISDAYYQSWGVMAHPHNTCGSGWWRPRFTRAFDAGCIVHAEANEWNGMFSPYRLDEIERMNEQELGEYQRKQASAFEQHVPTRERSLIELDLVLRAPAPPIKESVGTT